MDADAVEELWDTLDKTSLDPSMAYPSAMVALVTSTPNLGTRQKSRKSWFETTPGDTKIQIACEKRSKRSRQSNDEAETLLLTHFTNPPRVDFGKLRPGQTRTRTLLVKNPHDYEQEVKIEKIPTKKKFSVDENLFVVGPNETHPITITWSPVDEGGYREMFLFVVDNSYRLQTFAIGTLEAPPKKKKARPGLLGSKVKRPFSVIQTQSLASINHSYSPKKEEKAVEGPKIKPQETTKRHSPRLHAQSLPKCGSNNQENKVPSLLRNLKAKAASKKEKVVQLAKDGRDSAKENKTDDKKTRRSLRRSSTYSNMSCTGIEIPVIIGEKVEGRFCLPQDDAETPTTQFHNTRSILEVSSQFGSEKNVAHMTEECTVNAVTEKCLSALAEISSMQSNIFLETKDCTISNTKAKNNDTIAEMQPAKSQSVSGIPTGSEAKSERKSSKSNIDVAVDNSIENRHITLSVLSAAMAPESQSRRSSILDTSVTSTEYFSTQDQSSPMSEYFSSNSVDEGSIGTSECIGEETVCKVTSRCFEEGTVCVNESTRHDLTNSLNQNSFDNSMKQKESMFSEVTMTPVLVGAKDQIYSTPSFLSQNSILEESLSYKRKRSMKEEILEDSAFNLSSAEFAQLHDASRCKRAYVSPDSFLKDLNSTKERLNKNLASVAEDGEILSPDSVLNDSVPHSIMVRHLETIKLNLSDRSFENISSSSSSENYLRAMARKQKRRSRTSSRGKTLLNDRRETFIKKGKMTVIQTDFNKIHSAQNLKKSRFKRSLTEQAPVSSPRRTTFTVVKCKSVLKKKVHASWSFCEGVTPKQQKIMINSDEEVKDIQSHSTPYVSRIYSGKVSSSPAAPKVGNKVSFIFKRQNEVIASYSPKMSDSPAPLEPSFLKESLPLKEKIMEIVEGPSFVSEPSFLRNDFEKTTDCEEEKIRRCSGGTSGKGSPSSEDSLEIMLRSTKTLPSCPAQADEEFSTRLTMTVTKSRPSDALVGHTISLSKEFDLSDRKQQNQISSSDSEGDRRNTSDTGGYLLSDCTGEYLVSHSFPLTPHQLPDSPKLDHSRRSTHIVERSKVLNLSEVEKRKLFPPLEPDVQNLPSEENKEIFIAYQEEQAGQNINVVSVVKSDGSPVQDVDYKKLKWGQTIYSIHEEEKSITLEKAEPEFRMRNVNEGMTSLLFIPASRSAEIPRKDSVQKVVSQIGASTKRNHSKSKVEGDMAATKRLKSTSDVEIRKPASQIITRQRAASVRSVPSSKTMDRQPVKSKPGMVKCVAQSKLILLKKKGKSVLPKHPHPFAAKNMYYDERWMEKQERGFTNLLNFILTPPEEEQSNEIKVKVDAGKLILDTNRGNVKLAPTNEILSFRTYSVCRKMNRLRRAACRLFQSESIVKVIQKLEAEVESQRLIIRKDKMVHADLGVKQRILDMIISYNPLWLRIGLETIYGEVIPLHSNSDVYGLSRFIVTRLIGNPDIAEDYSHPTVPHLYRDGYSKALAQHMLKKFLMLVYFLDQSKQARLIDHNPCLFCKDSEFKSSKDLLITFSRDYLSGEGDITRHLGYLGCTVTYTQTHLDEFDFAVVKLATDLRDGIRLTRILEFLTGIHEQHTKLRVPAISRLQKVHNMEMVFKTLTQQGVDPGPNILARDIVDGHREKTLKLLWAIILNYQVEVLLNEEQLTEEVILLEKSLKVQNQFQLLHNLGKKNQFRRESGEPELHTKSPCLNLLLRWCRAVCAFYKMKIENFTVSFSDGRALCYLVHHYHPALLPIEAIKPQTSITYLEEMEEKGQTNLEQSFNDSSSSGIFADVENPEVFEQLLDNEKENFKILYEKVKELGGIPLMLRSADMSNTIPDEKVVVTYLLYLCARLLDIRHESRAARVIQMAWRKFRLHQAQKELEFKSAAASKIQKAVRKFLSKQREKRQAWAALILQRYWRLHVARKTTNWLRQAKMIAQQQRAACIIQCALQTAVQKKKFQNLRHSAICLQAVIRGFLVRCQISKQHSAAKTIQQYYRSRKLAQQVQCDYQALCNATVNLQALLRGHATRQTVAKIRAAIKIQSAWRQFAAQARYKRLRGAVIMIQKHFRGYKRRHVYQSLLSAAICIQRWYHSVRVMREQRLSYRKLKAAALILQTYFRSFKERRQYLRLKSATIRIQTAIRKFQAQIKYRIALKSIRVIQQAYRAHILRKRQRDELLKMRIACLRIQICWREYWFTKMERQCKAATVIQSVYRMFVTRRKYVEQKKATIVLQSVCRGYIERKNFQKMKSSAVLIQRYFHGYLQTKEAMERYQKLRNAAIKLQAFWRMHMQRTGFRHQKQAAILIQSHFKGLRQRQQFSSQKSAALKIQRYFRGYQETKSTVESYNTLKNAAIKFQAFWRMHMQRTCFRHQKQAAILIQSYFRGFCQRKQFSLQQSAALKIQQCYKGYLQTRLAVQKYNSLRDAAIKLQAFWRMVTAQRRYHNQKAASVVIQSAYRSHKQRKEYRKMRASTVIIQKRYREWLTMKKAHAHYKQIQRATITLQAAWRMYCARSKFVVKQRAAVIIQAYWRRLAAHRTYKQMKKAVVTIQNKYRARQKMIDARKQFILKRKAVNLIQAAYRGLVARRFMKTIRAAVLIQAAYRSYQTRKIFQKSRKAAIQIQAFLQMCLARRRYKRMRKAVIGVQRYYMARLEGRRVRMEYHAQKEASLTIQTWYRGCRVRNYIRHCNFAANLIQAQYRRYRVQQKFRKIKAAALKIQSWYRNAKLSQSLQKDYLVKRAAAIKIQAVYRCHLLHRSYLIYRNAVIRVQACVRGHLQQLRYMKLKAAVIVCQHRFRANLLACQKREQYLAQKRAAITIQSVFKCYQTRKQYCYRRKCVILAQTLVRGFFQRRKYKRMREVVIAMQKQWRSNMIAKRARTEYLKLQKAVLTLQSNFRGKQARKFVNRIQSAIKIQSALRMMLARSDYKRKVAKIMLLQSFYKARLARKEFQSQKQTIIFVQRKWRATLVARKCHLEYLATLEKIRLIQTTYRTYKERQRYQKTYQSIIRLQSRIRGVIQRQKYLKAKIAVCLIQSRYRAWQVQKIQRVEFQRVKHACFVIQSHFRALQTRRFLNRVRAAVTIQAMYRMYRERQNYQRIRSAVVVIQSFCRRVQATKLREQRLEAVQCLQRNIRSFLQVQGIRQEITRRRKAATMIQACYRGFLCRRQLVRKKAAMVIQAWWRSVLIRHNYLKTRWIIIQIQGHVRQHMAKQKLQRMRRKCRAAACIQSAYRGYLARKKIVQERLERQAVLEKIARAAKIHLSVIKVQRFWRKYQALKHAREKLNSVLVIQRWMQSKLVRLHYLKTLSIIRRIQSAVRHWLHRRNQAARVLQLATRRWLACRRVIKMHQAATKVQCMWRGYQTRRKSTSKKIVQARKRCEEARRSATEDKKLCNRTSSALDYLLKCKHLSQILDALMNLDVSTKLSPLCCEKFVEENAVPVIYKLIRSCNRSMPHMEIIKYSISILLNLSKYDRTTKAVLEAKEAVSTLLDLLQVYREKGQIFNKTCTLLGILAQNPHCNSVMLSEEKITDKLQSIYALTARKNKISENLRVTRAKLAAAKNCNSLFPVPTPVKHYKVRPDWILKNNKMREIEDSFTAITFVLESFNILPKDGECSIRYVFSPLGEEMQL